MKDFFIKADNNNSSVYELENLFWNKNKLICGVDEVGRGCLAGPIVVAAVILNPFKMHPCIKDSKFLSEIQLENIYKWLIENSVYAIGISNHRIIDEKNIYRTTQSTMKKAIFHLLQSTNRLPSLIAIDAIPLNLVNSPYHDIPLESWIKGESKSASIAAASIIAKVTRDQILQKTNEYFPAYGLAKHKGYGTAAHIAALKKYQSSIIHRKTFIKNFQKGLNNEQSRQQNIFC